MNWKRLAAAAGIVLALTSGVMADGAREKNRMMTGGKCTYREIQGMAEITSITEAPANANNCKNGVEIVFTFTPEDPEAVKSYLFPLSGDTGQRLTVGAGMNPPGPWVEKKGLSVGSALRCIRKEIVQGACTPVLFVFPETDWTDWQKDCF